MKRRNEPTQDDRRAQLTGAPLGRPGDQVVPNAIGNPGFLPRDLAQLEDALKQERTNPKPRARMKAKRK